jgi:hypothetical protein
MEEPTQEQLLNYIVAAIDFYERIRGEGLAPTDKHIQALFAACDVHVPFERIKVKRDLLRELEQEEESE